MNNELRMMDKKKEKRVFDLNELSHKIPPSNSSFRILIFNLFFLRKSNPQFLSSPDIFTLRSSSFVPIISGLRRMDTTENGSGVRNGLNWESRG